MTIFIETQRLIINVPVLADIDNWYALYAESDMRDITREIVGEWLHHHIIEFKQYGFGMGSVCLKATNEFIGRAGLFHYYDTEGLQRDIEIGYVIHKHHWNKGYASELAVALVDWGFRNLTISRLIALTRRDNIRSQHVLERAGMRYLKMTESDGEDYFEYQILRSGWLKRDKP
jgi:ribosomal-protein-alanine N-acetyltransferase